jgi:hypothetical protein
MSDLEKSIIWFTKLSQYHRQKIRDRYGFNQRTLKITDEMIYEVHIKEKNLPSYKRICNYNLFFY